MRKLVSSLDCVGNLTFQNTEVPIPFSNECLIRVKAFLINRGELKRVQNNPFGMPRGWDVIGIAMAANLTERKFSGKAVLQID